MFSFLDSSCGDMTWMPEFLNKRDDVIFTGWDIVQSNVDNHRKKFSDKVQAWAEDRFNLNFSCVRAQTIPCP